MIKPVIKEIILDMLNESVDITQEKFPKIIIMIGINGVGKTTSIGKMANYFKNNNKDVVIVAGDTFRALKELINCKFGLIELMLK